MSYNFSYEEFADATEDDAWRIQDSIVFLLDGTQQTFESNSMQKCLEAYNEVVRSKCSFNRKDKLGLIVYGTKDTNCQVNNITLLQKFEPCSVDTLKNIQKILDRGIDKYEELALNSNEKYPLYDAIDYAFHVANSSKTNTLSHKIIILCTCKDDPPVDERRRIEHLVATFKDANTELRVIGFTDSFDDSVFYKDLQIISGSCSNDNYKPMCLKDLEENILYQARSVSKLPWKISPDCVVEVSLLNLVSTPKYPPKVKLNNSTNEILEGRTVMREETMEQDPLLEDSEEPRVGGKKVITSDKLVYYKYYGGENIYFKPDECKILKNVGLKPSIEVLAFKPIMCDPIYHCKNSYFVTCSKNVNEESKNFFRTFVNRCTIKKVMPICKVITSSNVAVCNMIPSDDDGGFYMYKIPYNNKVRDFDTVLEAYKYGDQNKCPINTDAFYLFKKLTKSMTMEYNCKMFSNPKLEKCVAHLEALALDKILSSLPPDSTRPPPVPENLRKLKTALMNLLELHDIESARKRTMSQKAGASKRAKPDADVPTLARENKLDSMTVAALRTYLESQGITPKGTKGALIQKLKEHLGV